MSVTIQTGNSVTVRSGNRVTISAPGPQGPPGSGGGGTPGGTNTQVQFNDAGAFGGDAGLTYNKTTDTLTGVNQTFSGLSTLAHIHGSIAGNLYVHVKNTSGVTIAKGTPVYATGSVGSSGEVQVAAADYTNSAKMPSIGITDAQLIANAEGNAVVVGEVMGLATNSYSINQELFVGTAGLLGALPATGEAQSIAVVSRVHASTGIIVVNAQARLNAALRALANNVGSGLTALNASSITSGTLADAYIASAATWNAKQPAGDYITALIGDVSASGPGSALATLANTAVIPTSYTNANITVDAKGRITAASNGGVAAHASTHVTGGTDKIRDATASQDGLATAAQITKLNGIETGANAYTLPAPTTTVIGGVKRNTGSAGQFVNGIDTDGSLQYGTPSGGGSGDMTKAVYDPRNLNKITGLQGSGPVGVGGGVGGVLTMVGGDSGLSPQGPGGGSGGSAGEINTSGGHGFTSGEIGGDYGGGNGGTINTSGSNASDGTNGESGGNINTSNGGGDITTSGSGGDITTSGSGGDINTSIFGGSIDTSNGGGSISTRGTGSIGLGISGTRTTLTGTASADRAISLPNASGTLLLTNGSGASLTGTAASLTAGEATAALGLKTATTTVSVSGATAPTSGQVLTATSGTAATWQTPSAGSGDMVLLASATASGSASITFDNVFDASLYSEYQLKFQGVQPATDNVELRVQLRNATPADITDFHRNNQLFGGISLVGVGNTANSGGTNGWVLAGAAGNAANELNSGNLNIQPNSGQWTHASGLLYYSNSTSNQRYCITFAAACEGTTAPAGVKIYFSSGNISIGTFQLYGLKK